MTAVDFQSVQRQLAAHLRDPEGQPPPADIEPRRLAIYRRLIYDNIESLLARGFPVLRAITRDAAWRLLVADFIRCHRCRSPYFLDIGKEFLAYLQTRGDAAGDPPFMAELAHYEWLGLALDIADEQLSGGKHTGAAPLDSRLSLSPLARCLRYRYPVHRIGAAYQPLTAPAEPTFLVVYRNRRERVGFLEINAITAALLHRLEAGEATGRQALLAVAGQAGRLRQEELVAFGATVLDRLVALDIVCVAT